MHLNLTNHILPQQKQKHSVNDHLRKLFVNDWLPKANYLTYFRTCTPLYCTYNVTQYTKSLGAITLLISLYGGLILIYRLVTPLIINIIMKLKHRSTNVHINFGIYYLFLNKLKIVLKF